MSKFTLVLDSSQIASFLECPQKWANYYLKRLEPIGFQPSTDAMNAGTYGHKLLDIYYRLKAQGVGQNDALKQMLAYNPDVDVCECGCSKEFHCPVPALNIEECKRCNKCAQFRAHPFELSSKTRSKVLKRLNDYIYKYQKDDIQPLSEHHVEIGFSEPIHEDSENLFVLEGRMDLIGKWQGLDCVMDHKFQNQAHWLYPKSIQLKNYMLIAKTPMAVINYIRLQDKIQTSGTAESICRRVVTLNSVELAAWHKRLIQVFFRIKRIMQGKELERNWNACSGGYTTHDETKPYYCWFAELCETIDPKVAETKEKELFRIKENSWQPW